MRGRDLVIENLNEKERGYLFGIFEGDGYKIFDKKSRHYHVEFYLNSIKDIEIIDKITTLLKKINLKPQLYQDKRFSCKRIRVYSKKLFNILKKNIELKNYSKDFSLGYISGLIDSEGHVSVAKSYILVINTNKKILMKAKKFLKSIEIYSSVKLRKANKKDKKKSYAMYISVNFKSVNHLSIKADKLK